MVEQRYSGRTNLAIALELKVSCRTVERRLAHRRLLDRLTHSPVTYRCPACLAISLAPTCTRCGTIINPALVAYPVQPLDQRYEQL